MIALDLVPDPKQMMCGFFLQKKDLQLVSSKTKEKFFVHSHKVPQDSTHLVHFINNQEPKENQENVRRKKYSSVCKRKSINQTVNMRFLKIQSKDQYFN